MEEFKSIYLEESINNKISNAKEMITDLGFGIKFAQPKDYTQTRTTFDFSSGNRILSTRQAEEPSRLACEFPR